MSVWRVTLIGLALGAGLAATTTASATETITISGWGNNPEYFKTLGAEFERTHPDIKIETAGGMGTNAYFDEIFTQVAGGVGPDLILSNPQQAPILVNKGIWLKLDTLIQRDKIDFDPYFPQGWAYARFDGSTYAWPSGVDSVFPAHMFVYNRDRFAQVGIPDPSPKWTFQDMLSISQKLTHDTNGDGDPDVFAMTQPNPFWYPSWVWSNGGRILDEQGKRFALTETKAVQGLQFMVDLKAKYHVATERPPALFYNRKAAMTNIALPAVQNHFYRGELAFDWDVAPYPSGPDGISTSRAGSIPIGINATSKHIDAAWTFLKWLTSEQTQRWATLQAGIMSGPVVKSLVLSDVYLKPPGGHYDLTPIVNENFRYLPIFSGWSDLDALIKKALDPAWAGKVSVATAMQGIESKAQAIIDGAP